MESLIKIAGGTEGFAKEGGPEGSTSLPDKTIAKVMTTLSKLTSTLTQTLRLQCFTPSSYT